MKNGSNHTNQSNDILAELDRLHTHLEIPYAKNREEVWKAMEARLETGASKKTISLFHRPAVRLAMAASVLLLLGLIGVMRFYTVDVTSSPGQLLVVELPDGSAVQMSAVSSLTYHPYWWRFSRKLSLDGEAFFEVEKGNRFSVKSEKATTSVLGTRFNIYARDESYRVVCQTGKVKVVGQADGSEVILTANQKAELKAGDGFDVQQNINVQAETAWINDEFNFRDRPLKEVLEEVERQYGVSIQGENSLNNGQYQASISSRMVRSELNAEDILEMICTLYKLQYEKLGPNEYRISPKK